MNDDRKRFLTCLLGIMALAGGLIVGCDSPSPRCAISGAVLVDGKPVEQGSILFLPDAGHRGPSASCAILEGRYSFSDENGPMAGMHRVVVGVASPKPVGADMASEGGTGASGSGVSDPVASAGTLMSGEVTLELSMPSSSTAAKQSPPDSSSPSASNKEPNANAVGRRQWETAIEVPAADSPESAKPIDFSFPNAALEPSPAMTTPP